MSEGKKVLTWVEFEKNLPACKGFPEDTWVLTEIGYLPIQQIEVGDMVLSRCEITGEVGHKRVTKVYEPRYAKVSAIGCDYGQEVYEKWGNSHSALVASSDHPFWVEGKGWKTVRSFQRGDELMNERRIKATFRIANLDGYTWQVYHFEVEDFHTYFVEWTQLWVHD